MKTRAQAPFEEKKVFANKSLFMGQKMFPDANTLGAWISALKLPARIIAGLFLFSVIALLFDYLAVLNLAEFGALTRPVTIVAALLLGSLSVSALGGIFYDNRMHRNKSSLLTERRELQRAAKSRDRLEYEARVLKRIDFLSKEELSYLADSLRKNEQSFTAYVHSPHVANLMVREMVATPGGTHHQDHFPFFIRDFVWQGLLERKDELIAKDEQNNTPPEAARGSKRRVAPYD